MHGVDDDEFEVKLGRIGNRRARKETSYLRRVRQAADKAGVRSSRGLRASRMVGCDMRGICCGRLRRVNSDGQPQILRRERDLSISTSRPATVSRVSTGAC